MAPGKDSHHWTDDITEAVGIDKRGWLELLRQPGLATVFMTFAALVTLAKFNAPTEAYLAAAVAGVMFGLLEITYGHRKETAPPGAPRKGGREVRRSHEDERLDDPDGSDSQGAEAA